MANFWLRRARIGPSTSGTSVLALPGSSIVGITTKCGPLRGRLTADNWPPAPGWHGAGVGRTNRADEVDLSWADRWRLGCLLVARWQAHRIGESGSDCAGVGRDDGQAVLDLPWTCRRGVGRVLVN